MAKPRKYTNKEINDDSIAARKAAELIYTYDKVREMHPIDVTQRIETQIGLTTLRRYEHHNIEHFIQSLHNWQANGGTHFQLSWSTAEWADEDPLEFEVVKMKTETQAEWDARIENTREKYLNDAYAKAQHRLTKYNEDLNLYLALKNQFEPGA